MGTFNFATQVVHHMGRLKRGSRWVSRHRSRRTVRILSADGESVRVREVSTRRRGAKSLRARNEFDTVIFLRNYKPV